MDTTKPIAALFDFDGVVMDTETQYTVFWEKIGAVYCPEIENFGIIIKGQTLTQIYEKYFDGKDAEKAEISKELVDFEKSMTYNFIPGAVDFIHELRSKGVHTAIVTSSNRAKMANVYKAHPDLDQLVDRILLAEDFTRSKPFPDCYLQGAEAVGTVPENCVVFEDSFHGLQAGNAAGMKVVGLCTTNSAESIAGKCHKVISDFTAFTFDDMLSVLK